MTKVSDEIFRWQGEEVNVFDKPLSFIWIKKWKFRDQQGKQIEKDDSSEKCCMLVDVNFQSSSTSPTISYAQKVRAQFNFHV